MQKKGDADCFKFAAKKGQVWEIECYARRIGSPMDPVITIYKDDKAKSLIAGNDDARGQDSYLRWQVPEDGNYYIRITDHLGQGGDTYVYRVELTPVKPVLTIGIPRVERYGQTRQTVVIPRGNRYGAIIQANRADFGGPIELLAEELDPRRHDDRPADAPEHDADARRLRSGRGRAARRQRGRPPGEVVRSEADHRPSKAASKTTPTSSSASPTTPCSSTASFTSWRWR